MDLLKDPCELPRNLRTLPDDNKRSEPTNLVRGDHGSMRLAPSGSYTPSLSERFFNTCAASARAFVAIVFQVLRSSLLPGPIARRTSGPSPEDRRLLGRY